MNKNELKNICTDFGIVTGNLKKNDVILIIVDYQRKIVNEQENDSDISSITDDEKEDNSIDTSISQTSLMPEPLPELDGEDIDVAQINAIENDIIEIGYASKEKIAKFTEMCSKLSFTRVVGYDITPSQSDLDAFLKKQFEKSYLKKYNNIFML